MKQPQILFPPIRRTNGTWARNEAEKSEAFAAHLANIFKPNPSIALADININDNNSQDAKNHGKIQEANSSIKKFIKLIL